MSGLNLSFVLGFMLGFGTNDNVTVQILLHLGSHRVIQASL